MLATWPPAQPLFQDPNMVSFFKTKIILHNKEQKQKEIASM